MKIRIKRIDKSIPLSEHKTKTAAAIDLYARVETIIKPGELGYIPTNIAVEIPEGHFGLLVARSSTHKLGIMPANGFGVIDSDFNGDGDEPSFIALNFTKDAVTIEKGTRVAQLVLTKHETFELEEVDTLGNEDRGGIGSTGFK